MVNLVSDPMETKAVEQQPRSTTKSDRQQMMPPPVPRGLPNLGNTCFFNATLQCLMNTEAMGACLGAMFHRQIRLGGPYQIKLNNADKSVELPAMEVVVDDGVGPMTSALNGLVKEFHAGRSPNPRGLFDQVAKRVPRFRGYQQQDAQELLVQVLDGMRDEELQAIRRALKLSLPNTVGAANPQLINVLCSGPARPSIDSTFGGTLQQRIVCCHCGHNSLLHEPFLQLSLPLTWPKNTHDDTASPIHHSYHLQNARKQSQIANGGVGKVNSPRTSSINGTTEHASSTMAAGKNQLSKYQRKKEAKRKRKENKQKRVTGGAKHVETPASNGVDEEGEEESPEAVASDSNNGINGDQHVLNGVRDDGDEAAETVEDEANGEVDDKMVDKLDEKKDPHHNGAAIDAEGETLAAAVNGQDDRHDDDSQPLSLQAVLRRFTDPERLEGQNAYECEKCCSNSNGKPESGSVQAKERRPATKRYLINRPPPVLTLQLKRFEKVQHGKRAATKKFSARVDYPLELDLAPFCSRTAEDVDTNQNKVLYRLYGIVSHRGGLSGGHYVAYVRAGKRRATTRTVTEEEEVAETNGGVVSNGSASVEIIEAGMASLVAAENRPVGKGAKKRERQLTRLSLQQHQNGTDSHDVEHGDQHQWYCCDDSRVTPVDVKSMLRSVEAYILFYERVL